MTLTLQWASFCANLLKGTGGSPVSLDPLPVFAGKASDLVQFFIKTMVSGSAGAR